MEKRREANFLALRIQTKFSDIFLFVFVFCEIFLGSRDFVYESFTIYDKVFHSF